MKQFLAGAALLALTAGAPGSAQILGGGGLGGQVGGLSGNLGATLQGGIERTGRLDSLSRTRSLERSERRRAERRSDRRVAGEFGAEQAIGLGERRVSSRGSGRATFEIAGEPVLRTRGAVAATSRGLVRAAPTASGVEVFVPQVALPAPPVPRVEVRSYPAYSGAYYYEPSAVYVDRGYVRTYVDEQYQELEDGLRGTGATVERRGDDLVVLFPADVTFAFDRAEIRPRFYRALDAFARTLNAYPGTDVEVVGHTDAVGSETYNLGLSERRGRSVGDFLVSRRVNPTRLVVQAMGEAEPVATNATVEGRAANRRVELIVHPRAG